MMKVQFAYSLDRGRDCEIPLAHHPRDDRGRGLGDTVYPSRASKLAKLRSR